VLCWSAPYDAVDETMDELIQYISESILIYDKLLLVISEHSETKTSYRALTVAVKEALGKEGETSPPGTIKMPIRRHLTNCSMISRHLFLPIRKEREREPIPCRGRWKLFCTGAIVYGIFHRSTLVVLM
jgi:hypothetical protein